MFSTDEEVKSILDHPANLVNIPAPIPRRQIEDLGQRKEHRVITPEVLEDKTEIRPLHNGGRRPGDRNLSPELRTEIAIAARSATLEEVAAKYGVSVHHVHELKQGKITNFSGPNDELIDNINSKLQTPHELALQKLAAALTEITPERIKKVTRTRDLVNISVGLASIVRATAPVEKADPNAAGAQLVVYAPQFKQENHYETVSVKSK